MRKHILLIFLYLIFLVVGCANNEEHAHEMAHKHNFNGSAEVPEALAIKAVENPKYPIGSKAISKANHMGGMMDGVEVTIVAAYKTTAYETSSVMSDGTEMEKHRWIVHEEFVNAGNKPIATGTEIKTVADHMEGMKDSIQTIDSSVETTVYIVDFVTSDGHEVKNHKWVAEEDLETIT
ncbi:DUF1541 domain-containing protein [Robertmurraya sp. FSL R5-0851]|uniref:DUF1541 domain-containing protein n=1 Tax=Robertmurraya sp. FSL R5-0851 TaxID=2921584 RepID=UPI0030F88875